MALIAYTQKGETPFQQLLGYQPQLLENWTTLEAWLFESPTFSATLKEEVRRVLAQCNGCEYCKAKGIPSPTLTDERTKRAVQQAVRTTQVSHLEEGDIAILRDCFSDSEISELLALICFISACQRYGALLQLEAVCQI